MAGYMSIAGQLTGTPIGVQNISLSISPNTSNDFESQTFSLTNGFTSFTVPSWAVMVLILVTTAGNVTTLTLKGVTGDTGVGISLTNPTLISAASTPTNFGLTTNNTGCIVQITYM
jgi:hypothetical protein